MINRCPKNVPGDFYTDGECLACDLPESEAPMLFAELTDDNFDTYFIKQPDTADELKLAISACEICCINAVRYGGKDKKILERLGDEYCDYKIDNDGSVVKNDSVSAVGEKNIAKKWWQFW